MKGLLRTGWRLIGDHLLGPLWRCLMAYGSLHLALVPADAAHLLSALGQFGYVTLHDPESNAWPLSAGLVGPPAGHPERLDPDLPLTEWERLLAVEVWSAERPVPPGPPHRRRGRSAR